MAVPPLEQKGLPGYTMAAVGSAVIVTGAVVENRVHPPEAAMVYVTV